MSTFIERLSGKLNATHPVVLISVFFTGVLVLSIVWQFLNLPLPLGHRFVWFNTGNVPFSEVFISMFILVGLFFHVCIIVEYVIRLCVKRK